MLNAGNCAIATLRSRFITDDVPLPRRRIISSGTVKLPLPSDPSVDSAFDNAFDNAVDNFLRLIYPFFNNASANSKSSAYVTLKLRAWPRTNNGA